MALWQRSAHATQRDGAATQQLTPPRGRVKSRARRRRRRGRSLPCGELIELSLGGCLGWSGSSSSGAARGRPVAIAPATASLNGPSVRPVARTQFPLVHQHSTVPPRPVRHTHAWSPSLSSYCCWCTAARLQLMRASFNLVSFTFGPCLVREKFFQKML